MKWVPCWRILQEVYYIPREGWLQALATCSKQITFSSLLPPNADIQLSGVSLSEWVDLESLAPPKSLGFTWLSALEKVNTLDEVRGCSLLRPVPCVLQPERRQSLNNPLHLCLTVLAQAATGKHFLDLPQQCGRLHQAAEPLLPF